ncbi:integrin alpha-6-like isoform X2 [Lytechinus variegatus]|uniref:integrin alpha-6-like isoform X2 n=1 Tax=Lytechinus variegatus TaxID=7654 RepID=UPI001BB123AB|nr:integrin alpha-6-like isoform X2 [Lytechinus variegatus]
MARIPVAFATTFCILLAVIERTLCFNFETRLPVIKEGPGESYFGFSVAEHILTDTQPAQPFAESLLIVGAPVYQTNISATKPGGVFKCPFTSSYSDCEVLELDTEGNTDVDIKDNQWLGVSVVSQGPGRPVAACAHRHIYRPPSVDEYRGLGKCYFMKANLEKDIFVKNGYQPCISQTRPNNYDGILYKYCQAGTDLDVTRHFSTDANSASEYIMGVPGSDNWLGGIALANVPDSIRSINLITPLDYANNRVGFNSYLGFSVASAKLMSGNAQTYIAGAPRSESMGAVLTLKSESGQSPSPIYRIDAEKPSSSFGYDVAAADLNGDGYDDLIIGAPQYFYRDPSNIYGGKGGCVYIYLNKAHDGTFDNVEPIKLYGPIDSLFGQVIANIGDINLDGFEDIAIGAPYENNGQGAVYIYLGHSQDGIRQPAAQKITPSDLPMGVNGYPYPNASFGYSISGGVDLDGNGFPEITIGAYEVQQIAVLRGRPVINIEASLTLSMTEIDPNSTNCVYSNRDSICFQVELCMSYYCLAPEFNDPITINFDIEAEGLRRSKVLNSRVVFEDSGIHSLTKQTLVITNDDEACTPNYNVVLKPGYTDIFRPIPINLTYYIPEEEANMPQPGEPLPSMTPFPILQENTQTVLIEEVHFSKECAKDDGKCITDLDVSASIDVTGTPPVLRVGQQLEISMSVNIANREEDAYDARLVITYPSYLGFISLSSDSPAITAACNAEPFEEGANETSIICELGNPYSAGTMDSFVVLYDASTVPPDAEEFNITLVASSMVDDTAEDSNPDNNIKRFTIEVESITDILISGKGPEQLYISGQVIGESAMTYFEDIGLAVNQEWTIFNEGPGAVNTARVTIDFPYEVANGKWLLYLTEMPFVKDNKGSCNVTPAVYVNELGLRPKNGGVAYTPVGPDSGAAEVPQSRKRRQAEAEAVSSGGETTTARKDITLDCTQGNAQCLTIYCDLDPLTKEPDMNQVVIIVRSRIWNSTFLEDYSNARVKIITEGYIEIESAPYITQKREDNDRFKLSLTVTPDIKTLPPSQPLQWWIIALAVIGGLILLILLIILLWKCGFFERKTGYKYATVTQQQASGKAKTEKTAYYDDMYY